MTSQNVCKHCEVEQVFECDECVTFSDHCFKEELQGRWIAIMKLESSHKKRLIWTKNKYFVFLKINSAQL